MHFSENIAVRCPRCDGQRFSKRVLDVRVEGASIAEVLDLPFNAAGEFFKGNKKAQTVLEMLSAVGIGYLTLGRTTKHVSGGEAQRLKLVRHVSRNRQAASLIVLDEVSAGLHPFDVARIVKFLQILVDQGRTVIAVDHNLDLIKCADYVVELGPASGCHGGRVIGIGTPEDLAGQAATATGQLLDSILKNGKLAQY